MAVEGEKKERKKEKTAPLVLYSQKQSEYRLSDRRIYSSIGEMIVATTRNKRNKKMLYMYLF